MPSCSAAERWRTAWGIRRVVRLGESLLVDVPSVAGWLKPVILVPVGAFSGLSGVQIDALLAHELAHISRHDFLVNISAVNLRGRVLL